MNTQLFISHATPIPELLIPVENDPEGFFRQKPTGGFWTSSWRELTQDSDWVEWCRGENFGAPNEKHWFLLTPHPDCKIYTINSLKDFKRCLIEYGDPVPLAQKYPSFAEKRVINFEKVAQEFDGLHLTEKGNGETHLSYPNDLNGWDCESTLWFRWCFASVQTIPTPAIEEVAS